MKRKLYKLTNKLGDYYIIAEHPTEAQDKLETCLKQADYSFDSHRKVYNIELIAEEVIPALNQKYFFSDGNNLLL